MNFRRYPAGRFAALVRVCWSCCLLALLVPAGLFAQPSGGPYGPVQQRYELPPEGRIHYVAPDGRSEDAGDSLQAPTSLAAAMTRVVTGDTIVLRGGTYRTGGLVLSQGVTLQPYDDERPVLKGTEVAREWESVSEGKWRTRWTKLFPAAPADWWRRARHEHETPLHRFNNDMVFLEGELLASAGRLEDVDAGSYFIDYEHGWVYLGAEPAGKLVEITAHDGALVRTMHAAHGKPNDGRGLTIRGITFTQYAYRALEVEGVEPDRKMDPRDFGKEIVGSTFEHVTISFCSRVAGYFRGDGMTFRHCLIADCGTEGIYVINSGDLTIERCIVTRTNSAEKITGYYASAVKIFNQSYRAVVRDNLIIDNPHASGVWWDVGNVDGVFVNNWVERTNDGFFFEISRGAICAGNVFVNCNKGVRILNAADVRIHQNTFFNSVAWFERSERSAVGDHFGWHPSAGPDVHERHGHVFANNLLVADETFRGPLLHAGQTEKVRERLKESQLAGLDGNVYVRRARGRAVAEPLVAWAPASNERGAVEFAGWRELRAALPQFEAHGREFPDFHGPLFRSAELGHFEIARAFPGAGVAVPLPPDVRATLGWADAREAHVGAYLPN